jgi:hypothetical protein
MTVEEEKYVKTKSAFKQLNANVIMIAITDKNV